MAMSDEEWEKKEVALKWNCGLCLFTVQGVYVTYITLNVPGMCVMYKVNITDRIPSNSWL